MEIIQTIISFATLPFSILSFLAGDLGFWVYPFVALVFFARIKAFGPLKGYEIAICFVPILVYSFRNFDELIITHSEARTFVNIGIANFLNGITAMIS